MTDRRIREHFDKIYKHSPEEIPWNSVQPPELLVELVKSGKIRSGSALDLGCGAGNYAIYLAGIGFEVTGIDFSPRFLVADLTGQWPDLGGLFDFVYDWGLLHHIIPENRDKYVESVYNTLKSKGNYLSVCFNEKDVAFKGTGKYRQTNIGTEVYLSGEDDLRKLFGRFFEIIDFHVLEIKGKVITHIQNYCLMERKRQ
jgi:cyclopropane fatty-acyl-phospholipid synthase-like methyltransferase